LSETEAKPEVYDMLGSPCPGGHPFVIGYRRGKCRNCAFLDPSTREEFPNGMVRQGRCIPHAVQPNGRWDEDYCDIVCQAGKQFLFEPK